MDELYLVTGASGHVGNVVIRELLSKGKRVRALVLPNDPLLDTVDKRADIVFGNVCEKNSLIPFFNNPDGAELIAIHAAGIVYIGAKQDRRVYEVNVNGTKNVVELCRQHGVSKLIYVSSVHAIPEPKDGGIIRETDSFDPALVIGYYAKTKAEATALVLKAQEKGLFACVVHPSGIIGPYDYGNAHMTQMALDYAAGRLWACVNGGYDFVDVRDVADGMLSCIEKGKSGECYILSNRYITVREILSIMREVTGGRRVRIVFPFWFVRMIAPLAELYCKLRKQKPLFTSYSMYTLQSNSMFSNKKARQELGFAPRPIEQTLSDTVAWLKERGRL